jgi:hypothetical protein
MPNLYVGGCYLKWIVNGIWVYFLSTKRNTNIIIYILRGWTSWQFYAIINIKC